MASEDEDELAELRAARAARTGQPLLSMTALREKQRQAEEDNNKRVQSAAAVGPPRPPPQHQRKQAEEQDDGTAEADDDEQLLKYLPTSFGAQTKANKDTTLQEFIQQTRRGPSSSSFGPPRPPGAVGPPKPPPRTGITIAAPSPSSIPIDSNERREDGQDRHGSDSVKDVGPPRPPGTNDNDNDNNDGGDAVGPPRPGASDDPDQQGGDDDLGEGAGPADLDVTEVPSLLPMTHEVVLSSSHAKGLTCMDIDHTGSRLITGSMDYTIRIYDFNGMKRDMKAFREMEPQEGHPVLNVSWSPTGEQFLVVSGSPQAKIFDRDGRTLGEFIRGDMYIRDMRHTKGHVSGCTGGCWHPTDRYTVMTSSEDGTVRIWDAHNMLQKTVVKPTLAKPVRTSVTTCSYGQDGRLIAAGLMDGTIQLWNVGGKFGTSAAIGQVLPPKPQMIEQQNWNYVSRSNQLVRDAHVASNEISCLTFSQDGNTLLSRALDSTLKIWDLRKFKQPVKTWSDLPAGYTTTKAIFSPDESLILTGVGSSSAAEESGSVVVIDKSKLEIVQKVGMPSSVTALAWHHRLDQVFIGIGNRKSGSCHVLYEPGRSERGVLYGAARATRKPSPFDITPEMIARAVYEAPIYRRERLTGHKRREQMAADAVKHHKPNMGMAAGAGKQGRIGTTQKTLLTQHLLKLKGDLKPPDLSMDPREAILRHGDKQDVFSRLTDAYRQTQPEPIFAQEEEEEEEDA